MKKYILLVSGLVVVLAAVVFSSCKKDSADSEKTPTASFTYSPVTIYTGTTVTFNNESQDAANYKWSFGDGQTSSSTNPTHSYSTSGYKTVELTAYSASGSKINTTSQSLYVNAAKGDVMFWTDESTVYNITVSFRGTNKTITSYYTYTPSSCGASGCATYWDIDPGTYYFTASNYLYNWSSYVTVYSGSCSKMLLYADKGEKQTNPESQSMEIMTLGVDNE